MRIVIMIFHMPTVANTVSQGAKMRDRAQTQQSESSSRQQPSESQPMKQSAMTHYGTFPLFTSPFQSQQPNTQTLGTTATPSTSK